MVLILMGLGCSGDQFARKPLFLKDPFPQLGSCAILLIHDKTETEDTPPFVLDAMIDKMERYFKIKEVPYVPYYVVRGVLEGITTGDIHSAFDLDLAPLAKELGVDAFFIGEIHRYEETINENISTFIVKLKWKLIDAHSANMLWDDEYESTKKRATSNIDDTEVFILGMLDFISKNIISTFPIGIDIDPTEEYTLEEESKQADNETEENTSEEGEGQTDAIYEGEDETPVEISDTPRTESNQPIEQGEEDETPEGEIEQPTETTE